MKREITLMIHTEHYEDKMIDKLKEFCKKESIPFIEKGFRGPHMYDFIITGETADYENILKTFKNVRETYYAELGNLFDFDKENFLKWQDVMIGYFNEMTKSNSLDDNFFLLVRNIDDVAKLEYLLHYPMSNFAKTIIKDKLNVLKGQKTDYEKDLESWLEKDNMLEILKLAKEGQYALKENDFDALIQILKRTML